MSTNIYGPVLFPLFYVIIIKVIFYHKFVILAGDAWGTKITEIPSLLMGKGEGGGGHGMFPLTPALSHQGKGR
jgi:hypothetical protein